MRWSIGTPVQFFLHVASDSSEFPGRDRNLKLGMRLALPRVKYFWFFFFACCFKLIRFFRFPGRDRNLKLGTRPPRTKHSGKKETKQNGKYEEYSRRMVVPRSPLPKKYMRGSKRGEYGLQSAKVHARPEMEHWSYESLMDETEVA